MEISHKSRILKNFDWRHPVAFQALILFFALSLFIDSANLTDIFYSGQTIHFDEVIDQPIRSGSQPVVLTSHASPTAVGSIPIIVSKIVILDQDGPSESASGFTTVVSFTQDPPVEEPAFEALLHPDLLYLRYCTLLL
jgi:hypothetical protein